MPGFLASCEKKLGNERFVASAPPDLVEKNEKMVDGETRLTSLEQRLNTLMARGEV